MLFNSMNFLIFFPVVLLIYFVFPKKIRYLWLLAASYYFYACWNLKHTLLLFFSTLTTYVCGLFISYFQDKTKKRLENNCFGKSKKLIMFLCILINILILFLFKYFDFAVINLNRVLSIIHCQAVMPAFDVVLPVGISFYTFQALSYIIDVYKNDIPAEKNFFKYALFVSFFPQLVAGPIERSKNLLTQINLPTQFSVVNARTGLLTMAYGLFMKVVVADNIAGVVNPIFNNFVEIRVGGIVLVLATILFAFQIYCDFQGYSQLAIGSAKVLGYHINENFDSPYYADNVQDFWRRWHISLTTWFKDYLYIPLGGNRKGRFRKEMNTLIVFFCSGLWHGASWHYVLWGGLNGFYLAIQDMTKDLRIKIYALLHIDTGSLGWKLLTRIITFSLISYSWLLFRANGLRAALQMTKIIIRDFRFSYLFSNGIFDLFGNTRTFFIILASLIIISIIDYLNFKGIDYKTILFRQQIFYRWFAYITIIVIILVWGAYGEGYEQTQFIYFQF